MNFVLKVNTRRIQRPNLLIQQTTYQRQFYSQYIIGIILHPFIRKLQRLDSVQSWISEAIHSPVSLSMRMPDAADRKVANQWHNIKLRSAVEKKMNSLMNTSLLYGVSFSWNIVNAIISWAELGYVNSIKLFRQKNFHYWCIYHL